jgi:hypothetical protein
MSPQCEGQCDREALEGRIWRGCGLPEVPWTAVGAPSNKAAKNGSIHMAAASTGAESIVCLCFSGWCWDDG